MTKPQRSVEEIVEELTDKYLLVGELVTGFQKAKSKGCDCERCRKLVTSLIKGRK